MTDAALIASGVVLIVCGAVWRLRLPKVLGAGAVGLGAGLVAVGGLRILGDASVADWVVAIPAAVLGSLFHARVVLGPFGPPGAAVE